METDLWFHLTYNSRGSWHTLGIQCMPCSARIISEMLPEIHTVEKFDFLKSMIYSQIILIFYLEGIQLDPDETASSGSVLLACSASLLFFGAL